MIHMAIGYKGNIVSGVENLDTKVFREFIELNENVVGTTLGLRGEVIINRDKQTVKIPISFENSFGKSPEGFTSFINTNIDIFKKYYKLNNSFDNHLLAKYNIKHRYRIPYNGNIYDALEYKNNKYLLAKGIEYRAIPNLIRIMEAFMTNEGINVLPAYLIEFIRDNNLIIAKEKNAPDNLVDEYKESKKIDIERQKEMDEVLQKLREIKGEDKLKNSKDGAWRNLIEKLHGNPDVSSDMLNNIRDIISENTSLSDNRDDNVSFYRLNTFIRNKLDIDKSDISEVNLGKITSYIMSKLHGTRVNPIASLDYSVNTGNRYKVYPYVKGSDELLSTETDTYGNAYYYNSLEQFNKYRNFIADNLVITGSKDDIIELTDINDFLYKKFETKYDHSELSPSAVARTSVSVKRMIESLDVLNDIKFNRVCEFRDGENTTRTKAIGLKINNMTGDYKSRERGKNMNDKAPNKGNLDGIAMEVIKWLENGNIAYTGNDNDRITNSELVNVIKDSIESLSEVDNRLVGRAAKVAMEHVFKIEKHSYTYPNSNNGLYYTCVKLADDNNEELPQPIVKDTDNKEESKFKRTLREWIENNIEVTDSDDRLYNVDITNSILIDYPEFDRASIRLNISSMITEMFNIEKSYERPNSYVGLHYYGIKIIEKDNTPPSAIREDKSKGNRYTTEEIAGYTVDNNHLEEKKTKVLNYLEEYFEDQMNQGDGNFLKVELDDDGNVLARWYDNKLQDMVFIKEKINL